MTICIGLVDLRLPSPHGSAAIAAWRAGRRSVWLARCRHTLTTDTGESQADIVRRLQAVIAALPRTGSQLDLDIVCHGSASSYEGVPGAELYTAGAGAGLCGVAYTLQLGTGLGFGNMHYWGVLANVFRRVRLYACGEQNPVLAAHHYASSIGRAQFCRRFADLLNADVVSCPATIVYSINASPTPDPSIAVDGWEGTAPAVVYRPGGRETPLPASDRLGR